MRASREELAGLADVGSVNEMKFTVPKGCTMIAEKICRKCDKQFPMTTIFCPECGSMTLAPEAPEPPARVVRTRPAPVRSTPLATPAPRVQPPKVRLEHTREDFISSLTSNGVEGEDVEVITKLMNWSERVASLTSFGDSVKEGGRIGFRPLVRVQDREVSPFWISTDGRIEVAFGDWTNLPPFDSREKRLEMLRRLNGIKLVKILEDKIAAYPPVPVRALREQAELDKFIGTYEWFLGLVLGQR